MIYLDMSATPISSSALSLVMFAGAWTPISARANPMSPPASENEQVKPEIDVEEDPPPVELAEGLIYLKVYDSHSRERLERTIAARVQTLLSELGVTPPGDTETPWSIGIEVRGFSRMYEFSISAIRGDELIGPTPEFIKCTCSSEELREQIEVHLRDRITDIQIASAEPAQDETSRPPRPVLVSPPVDAKPRLLERPKARGGFGAPGIVGIVSIGAGMALGIFGIYRAARGEVFVEENQQRDKILYYKTPATDAAIGGGVVLALGGVALILVDQLACKSRPRGCKKLHKDSNGGIPLAFRF